MLNIIPLYVFNLIKYLILPVIFFFIDAIIHWNIFKKSGENSKYAFIPFYRVYILYRIIDLSKIWFWVYVGLVAVGKILNVLSLTVPDIIAFRIINVIVLVGDLIIHILITDQLGNSFGKKKGFKIGYFFLPTIFAFILAFDKSEYIGPNGVKLSKSKRKKLKK